MEKEHILLDSCDVREGERWTECVCCCERETWLFTKCFNYKCSNNLANCNAQCCPCCPRSMLLACCPRCLLPMLLMLLQLLLLWYPRRGCCGCGCGCGCCCCGCCYCRCCRSSAIVYYPFLGIAFWFLFRFRSISCVCSKKRGVYHWLGGGDTT